jgi:hypothetical protein
MLKLPPPATLLTFGTFLAAVALVIYRLLWAGASLAGTGMLPRSLQRWRRWLQGERLDKKPN